MIIRKSSKMTNQSLVVENSPYRKCSKDQLTKTIQILSNFIPKEATDDKHCTTNSMVGNVKGKKSRFKMAAPIRKSGPLYQAFANDTGNILISSA